MDKLHEISAYIADLKIKKVLFGGYDKTEVEMKFGELLAMFKKCMQEEQDLQKNLASEYEQKLNTSQMLMNEMNKKLCAMMEAQKEMENEKEKMKDIYKEYCSNILQQYSDSLRALSTEFTQILENITNLQQNIIEMDVLDEIAPKALIETQKTEETE